MKNLQTKRQQISAGWQVRELQSRGTSEASDLPWLPAQVPGHVHLDMLRAGVIEDPFYRLAERGCAWIDETDWVYETTFQLDEPAAPETFLDFQGLDTIAEITLNGEPLAKTDNMFIPHEFPVGHRLRSGKGDEGLNTLRIVFRSALRTGRERQKAWIEAGNDTLAPHWFVWGPRSFVRKAQYMYGWDWGPELVSCGIWKPVQLVQVPVARLLDWSYSTEFAENGLALVRLEVEVERTPGGLEIPLILHAAVTGVSNSPDDTLPAPVVMAIPAVEGKASIIFNLSIENARLWWPNLYKPADYTAGAVLYELELSLLHADDLTAVVDSRTGNVGLRTVELIREPDAEGSGESFLFRVNGRNIFIKGANWIPADSFPSRLRQDTHDAGNEHLRSLDQLIFAAADAGFNMLRVWGGGLYESEHFYDLCDHYGILVWQDFPYGCAYYPDTGKYAEAARREATAAARRLRVHPSLAIWCGNNENHQMHHDGWAGADNRPPRYLGEKLYHEVLPEVLEVEDPGRPYWPSSPYGGDNPNSEDTGDRHDWDVWHGRGDWIYYREDNSRFVSEFGFASSCGLQAWDRCLERADRWPRSAAVRWHDKTRKGYETYLGFIQLHFPEAQTLEDLVYYSQLNQAEALKCGLEHWRQQKGRCWGLLFWQINDCWPVQSWAIIDSEEQPKAAYYAVQRAYAPALLSLARSDDDVDAYLTNDLEIPLSGVVTLAIRTFEGEIILEESTVVSVDANAAAAVAEMELAAADGQERNVYLDARFVPDEDTIKLLVHYPWDYDQHLRNLLFLAEPRDLNLMDSGLTIDVARHPTIGNCFLVTFFAERFAAYLWWRLEDDSQTFEPSLNDNWFHLRPGESRSIIIDPDDVLQTVEDVRSRLHIRTL